MLSVLWRLPSSDEDAVDVDAQLAVFPTEADYVPGVLAVDVIGYVVVLIEVSL